MIYSISKEDIFNQIIRQLSNFFFVGDDDINYITSYFDEALYLCEENFKQNPNKYFQVKTETSIEPRFNPYHSVQYMIFLYYLANCIYKVEGSVPICDKIYYLNKIMNSVDIFYAVELPKCFGAEHPVGSVIGRASYADGFFFYQCCTVGGSFKKDGTIVYPVIEENVRMYANSTILGNSHIGKNTKIGAGAIVKDQDVPEDSIVFGESPNLIIKRK